MLSGGQSRRRLGVVLAALLGVCLVGVPAVVGPTAGQSATPGGVNLTDVYETGPEDGYQEVRDIVPTADGGLMALLVSGSDATETTIVGVDGSGNIVSQETVPGRYESLARVDNDSYAAAGTRGEYAVLTRVHEDGWVEWTERYGGNETDVATDVASAPNGDAYLLASTESVNNDSSDLWVLRVDDEGEVRWDRVVEHDSATAFPQGERLRDGSLIATTQTQRSVDGEVDGRHDVATVRLAPDGTVAWRTNVSGPGDSPGETQAFDVVPSHDGGVLLVGTTTAGVEGSTAGFWAATLSASGDLGWQRRYDADGEELAQSAVRTTDGYVLGGATVRSEREVRSQLLVIDAAGDEQFRTTADRNAMGISRIQAVAWTGIGRLAIGGLSASETESGLRSNGWIRLVEDDLGGVDPGPSTWQSQHSEAERAGAGPTVEDSPLGTVLVAGTALSVVVLVLPYGLRRLRRRR